MQDSRYPCVPDPSYVAPKPAQVQEPINPFNTGWCAAGYYRPCGNCDCVVDPMWRPPTGTEGDYVNVGGTLIRKSELSLDPTIMGGGATGGLGLDSSSLMLLGGLALLLVVLKKR